jgi:L-ascorbate metabolism protein UlaG (beta-lactamase superfamily)
MNLTTETLPWYHRRHHCRGGFQNPEDERARPLSIWKGLTWSARRFFNGKTHAPPPSQSPDVAELRRRPERLRVTWIGHTTVLVQTPGFTLLTDPIFSRRASPVTFAGPSRLAPPALPLGDLPEIDAVVLSHDHYDHCDRSSLEALYRRHEPTFFVPLGVAAHLRDWGVGPVVELDWWQRATLAPGDKAGPLRLTCTPARHFSGRSLFDRNATLWSSWMIEAPATTGPSAPGGDGIPAGDGAGANGASSNGTSNGTSGNATSSNGTGPNGLASGGAPVRVYFGGDTGDGSHFAEIGERLPPADVALLPIGAFQPRALMEPVHIGPEDAVRALDALGAARAVPTHWGAFDLAEETVQAPAEELRVLIERRGLSERFCMVAPGEVLSFGTPTAADALATQREEVPVEEPVKEMVAASDA